MHPPTCELLFTGNEILIGKTLNTNGQWLAQRLTSLGFRVKRFTVIEDDINVISTTLREILGRKPKLVIISGGLGPTFDDKTLEGVAKALRCPLHLHNKALEMVKEKYMELHKLGVVSDDLLTEPRKKMAILPEGATPLPNPVGAAPGVFIEWEKIKIICLPGVPKELKAIFDYYVVDILKELVKHLKFVEKEIRVKGVVESDLAPITVQVMRNIPQVYIKTHPVSYEKESEISIHLTSIGVEKIVDRNVEEALKILKEKIKNIGGKIIEKLK